MTRNSLSSDWSRFSVNPRGYAGDPGKLPILSNVKYNEYIKEAAKAAGIDKPVTTHWARHTGATLLLNAGVPIEIVSKVCGHASVKMTERIYAKMLPKTIVKAVNDAEGKI